MNKLWAGIVSLTLVAQVCAVVEEGVPAAFNYRGKSYQLSIGSGLNSWANALLFLEQGCLKYSWRKEVVVDESFGSNTLRIVKATDEDYASFKGHENEVIGAVLLAYKEHPKVLEQLRRCRMFDKVIGDTPVYENFLRDLQRDQQRQRDQFLKTRVIPAVAIAAAVGVAVKYRTALKRMAIEAKDRIVAWWHKSAKKTDLSKAISQQNSAAV